jgi:NDP-sugar pyrophosphorylase family protein
MDPTFRSLTDSEIEQLKLNRNTAENWQNIKVTDSFNPGTIHNSSFYGFIYYSDSELSELRAVELTLPVGIYHSTLRNVIIESDCTLYAIRYISGYHIKKKTVLFDISTLSASKTPLELPPIETGNENGNRSFYPSPEMNIFETYLCSKLGLNINISDSTKLKYSIGPATICLSTKTIHNSFIGENVVIHGAELVKNCILPGGKRKTQIGHGVILKNGIMHEGSSANDGVTAESFILFSFSHLSNNARFSHSVLGSNSHVSGGEIQNSLLFPFHEQHHNSSFLCSSIIMGQTNIAAGAVIGSNHNSRRADGELMAGRGFWPGLTSSISFPSRFSSFTLIKNGRYSHSIKIIFPFSLLTQYEDKTAVIPAYWLMYNLYALFRNQNKFQQREKRPGFRSEYSFLDIDTVYEMEQAINFLNKIVEKQGYNDDPITLSPEMFDFSDKPLVLLKSASALKIYTDFCELFCVLILIKNSHSDVKVFPADQSRWMILDQYRFTLNDLEKIKKTIEKQKPQVWYSVHNIIERQSKMTSGKISRFAFETLRKLRKKPESCAVNDLILECVDQAISTCDSLYTGVCKSRTKDFKNPLRDITFDYPEEKDKVYASFPDPVIKYTLTETEKIKNIIEDYVRNNS